MGIFDYNCYIDGDDCPLKESGGQDFTFGNIFAVNKKLTKKIPCEYSGYGYGYLNNGDIIYDLLYLNDGGFKKCIEDKESYFACDICSKVIENEYENWNEFYEKPDTTEIMKENIDKYQKKLKFYYREKERIEEEIRLTNLLLDKEKIKLKLKNSK